MMHYLKCIALLNFLLKKLCEGQRQQVPVSTVNEAQRIMVSLKSLLEESESVEIAVRLDDIMSAIISIKSTEGLTFLTEAMKESLVVGIREMSDMIAIEAFMYFRLHDFELTEEIKPVLRSVVEVALEKGVI